MYIKIIILILLIAIIGFLLYSLYFYKETFENNILSKKYVPVDVIIPCIPRDTPKLERVLKSIERQTKLPHKVIIAHSELNDNEAYKIEKQYDNFPFKVVVNNTTEKKYAGENRNRGFSSSEQPFISFFDADDEMKPDRLEEIIKVFNTTDSKCVMHLFKKNSLPKEYYNDEDIIKYISKNNSNNIDKNTNFSKLRKNGYEGLFPSLHHGTPTIKKEVFEKVKQSNNPRGQDQDFIFDIFEHFKNNGNVFTIINKPLQTYVPAKVQNTKIETFQSKSNSSGKISVLILSYNRPHNLDKSLPILSKYKLIDEIVVSQGHPDYYKEFKYPKVKNIKDYKNNEIYGGARRWFTAANDVKNDIVVILDDDIIPSEELINKTYDTLIKNYEKNTIYGNSKRLCDKNGYKMKVNKNYNAILTRYFMCKKSIIKDYCKLWFKKDKEWLIKYHGNCEDLAFNKFINKYYNEKGLYIDGKVIELDGGNGYSSKSDHIEIRNKFCKTFID